MKKIQYLEDDSRYKRTDTEDVIVAEKPKFGRPLKNIEHLPEGKSAHLEATLTPVNDPTMVVEWYRDGRPIPQGHKFKTTYDFGYVALDILYAYPEESGTYMCKARNAVGEAVTTCVISVDCKYFFFPSSETKFGSEKQKTVQCCLPSVSKFFSFHHSLIKYFRLIYSQTRFVFGYSGCSTFGEDSAARDCRG